MPLQIPDLGPFQAAIARIDSSETDPSRHLAVQMDQGIVAAVRSAKATGKSAEITVKLKIKPGPKQRVELTGAVAVKVPAPATNTAVAYADARGLLHDHATEDAVAPLPGVDVRQPPRLVERPEQAE